MKDKSKSSLEWMKNFASWSVLDLLLKDDELFFSGYTDVDNSKQFFAKYSADIPVNSNIFSVLPYNTNFILDFGVTNFLNKRNPESLIELSKKTGLNIEAFFKTIDSDICLASSASRESQLVENSWVIVKLKDKKAAADYLNQLGTNSESSAVESYENYIFRNISSDNLISSLFGLPSWDVDRKWYTIYKDYAVFAASTAALKSYISSVELDKTLANNDNFISFSKNISHIFKYNFAAKTK